MSATDMVYLSALSTLYARDKLLAILFVPRHEQTLHCWFPAYEPELVLDSGGTVLVKPLTEEFAADGIGLIEIGRGAATYKMRACTGVVPLGEGECSSPPCRCVGIKVWLLHGLLFDRFVNAFCDDNWMSPARQGAIDPYSPLPAIVSRLASR
ncbi:MAG: GNAT family N-acetyltransferase [Betaproteobacteria bacterium]|nr:GNAT family N-acetyltransferase [Betaproteobacteria bacterium]